MDTLDGDTINVSVAQPAKNEAPQVKVKETPKVEKEVERRFVEEKLDTIVPVKADTVVPIVVQKVWPSEPPKPANRIVSYSLLENYEFGNVSARR